MIKKILKQRKYIYGLLLLTLSILVFKEIIPQYLYIKEKEQLLLTKQIQYQELQQLELSLNEEIDTLHSNNTIEDIARSEYYMSKPGETIFISKKENE